MKMKLIKLMVMAIAITMLASTLAVQARATAGIQMQEYRWLIT